MDLKPVVDLLLKTGADGAAPKGPVVTVVDSGIDERTTYVTQADGEVVTHVKKLASEVVVRTKSLEAFVAYCKRVGATLGLGERYQFIRITGWGEAQLVMTGPAVERVDTVSYAAPFSRAFAELYQFAGAFPCPSAQNTPAFSLHSSKSLYDFVMAWPGLIDESAALMQLLQSVTVTTRTKTDFSDAFVGVNEASYSVRISTGGQDANVIIPRFFDWAAPVLSDHALNSESQIKVLTLPVLAEEKLTFEVSFEDVLATRLEVCELVRGYLAEHLEKDFVLLID